MATFMSKVRDNIKKKQAAAAVKSQMKADKKKTAVKGTMKGKQVDTTKGPNYKKTTASKKSTAPKTSVVNKATTGMKSEKTGPNMSRGTPKRASVVNGANTYNQGGANLKSAPATKKRMEDKAKAKKKVQKRKGPSGPSMTSFR